MQAKSRQFPERGRKALFEIPLPDDKPAGLLAGVFVILVVE
jgi:hypothetical protein